jgi:hypothetical protein
MGAEINRVALPGQAGQRMLVIPHLNRKSAVMHIYHLSYGRKPGQPRQKARPYLQSSQSRKGWRYSTGRIHT